ncbi:MAG: outer membrane protein transport protein [Candidatus Zixiibacteriota bacterium]
MSRFVNYLILAFILILSGNICGQDEAIAFGFNGYGARQMAMGGAGVMTMDGTALFYNPANLARIPRIEFNLGLSSQKYKSNTETSPVDGDEIYTVGDSRNNSRLNSAIITIPYPTYRGSLVIGIGMVRSVNFDAVSNFYFQEGDKSIFEQTSESGGINRWGAGLGIDLSPRISFGGAVYLMYGKHEINFESVPTNTDSVLILEQIIKNSYLGVGTKASLAMQLAPYLAIGLTADLPISYSIEAKGTLIEGGIEYYGTDEYDLVKPFVFSVGVSSRFKRLLLVADLEYIDWSQLKYKNNIDYEMYNDDIRYFYRDVLKFKVGAEYTLPSIGLSLRSGFISDPLPYKKRYIDKDRRGFSFGLGYLIDQVMTIDIAYVQTNQTRVYQFTPNIDENDEFTVDHDASDEITLNLIYVTAAYRF